MSLEEGRKAQAANDYPLAARLYRDLWAKDKTNFRVLSDYVYCGQFVDRAEVIGTLREYIALAKTPADRARGYDLLLTHNEAHEREKAGLSTYSSDNLYEPPYIASQKDLQAYQDAVMGWALLSPIGEVEAHKAAVAFLNQNYQEVEERLDPIRHHLDPRFAAAHFSSPWFDHLDKVLPRFLNDLPPVDAVSVMPDVKQRVFVGCDGAFFSKYGIHLLKSLKKTDCVPHFHIFDSEDFGKGEFDAMTDWFGKPFTMDIERTGLDSDQARFYYAPIRLVRLWELMRREPAPTIFLDADVFVRTMLSIRFCYLGNHDVLSVRMPGRTPYHTQINASVVGINPTGNGMAYLTRVAAYIAQCFRDGTIPWCLDQLALHGALRNMELNGEPLNARAWGPKVYDGTMNAMIVPQKVTGENKTILENLKRESNA